MLRTCLVTAPSSALRERNHTMKDLLFLLSDLWMIAACYMFGWRFIRRYGNYLLGLEMAVVGTSGTNFLFWSLLSGDVDSPFYRVAYFFDAFSRSFGATLILVLGLMAVTHRYKPSRTFDVGVFGLAALGGLALGGLHDDTLHVGVATFYVVMNLLTTPVGGHLDDSGHRRGHLHRRHLRLLPAPVRRRGPHDLLHTGPHHLGCPGGRLLLRLPGNARAQRGKRCEHD
jgi:hypothetical protein